jgi:hypothetical protein
MPESLPNSLVDEEPTAGRDRPGYEPPTVTPIGNARDLLAGSAGSVADAGVPGRLTRPSGG